MSKQTTFLFDFDSTFIQAESFDELIALVLGNHSEVEKQTITKAFKKITEQCMDGQFGFAESLDARFQYLYEIKVHRDHIDAIIEKLKEKISPSFLKHQAFFKQNADNIYILSGGFIDIIWPIVEEFGIHYEHVLANNLIYDNEGNIIDYNKNNVLSQNQGKAKKVKNLHLTGHIIVVGDGYTDYEIKKMGLTTSFFCYTETAKRPHVMQQADAIIEDLDGLFLACNIGFCGQNQSLG